MAIPKLLEQMRHAVQDSGDDMSGAYSMVGDSSLLIENVVGVPLIDLASYDDPNNISIFLKGYNDEGHSQLTLYSNTGSDNDVALKGIANPQDDNDAAPKSYVDKALENTGGTFYAQFGTTTYAEVVEAFNAGKTIKALCNNQAGLSGYILDLVTRPTGSNTLYFVACPDNSYANTWNLICQLTSASAWGVVNTSRGTSVSNPLQYNGITGISTNPYYRPIRVSTSAPTSSDGNVGDIWIQYFS